MAVECAKPGIIIIRIPISEVRMRTLITFKYGAISWIIQPLMFVLQRFSNYSAFEILPQLAGFNKYFIASH